MWGLKTPRKSKTAKSRLLISTKGEEDFLKYLRKDSVNPIIIVIKSDAAVSKLSNSLNEFTLMSSLITLVIHIKNFKTNKFDQKPRWAYKAKKSL